MAQLFGKNYQETGSSSSPLLLRSNGEIKLQWGNKFIDLVKNGKINSEAKQFIYIVDSKEDINNNGIYLINSDQTIWINIEGVSVQLADTVNSYVSFLTEQDISIEQKEIALTNIGLFYNTLEDVTNSKIQSGLIYVKDTNKLYLVKDGNVNEYQVTSSLPSSGKFDDLTIGNISIKENSINSSQLNLSINNIPYIQLQDNSITCNLDLIVNIIKSSNYNRNSSGYSIYQEQNKSILDIDSINWRNIESELPKNQKDYTKYTTLGEYNIVTQVFEKEKNEETGEISYELTLKYPNTFIEGYLDADLETTYNIYLLTPDLQNEDSKYFILDKAFPTGSQLTINFEGGGSQTYSNQETDSYAYPSDKSIESAYFNMDNYYIDIDIKIKHAVNPEELKIVSLSTNSITVIPVHQDLGIDLVKATQFKIYQARVPQFIQGEGFLALRKWDSENSKYVYHTIMGTYKESEFGISDDVSNKFGFYSDDVKVTGISLSGAQFSGQLPSFTETKPDTVANNQFPTMEIVNEKIKKAVDDAGDTNLALINKNALPKGSIVMFNNADKIPDKWQICDGTNGTPNLIDKFIKAGMTLKEESIELTKYTSSTTGTTPPEETTSEGGTTETTPGGTTPEQPKEDNKYKLDAYSLIFIMKMK